MSNALAIAAVTQTLVHLITNEIATDPQQNLPSGIRVTAQPPDAANRDTTITHQVNLFLYNVVPNAAWRNMPLPNRVLPGETAQPPLALNLYYVVTAYARETADLGDINSHNLLGRVMRVLYDHPVLSAADITMPQSDVQNQIERLRITLQPLNIREIYELWAGFQTQYRLSVSYEVAVVLIESARAVSTPLPVLQIGRNGQGATVTPDIFPYPVLFSVSVDNVVLPAPPGNLGGPDLLSVPPIALPGDVLVIQGHRLNGPKVTVSFVSLKSTTNITIDIPASDNTGNTIRVVPTAHPGTWTYGYYTLAVQISDPSQTTLPPQTTNTLTAALAPQIDTTTAATMPSATRKPNGDVVVTLKSVLPVQVERHVSLLLNDNEIASDARTGATQSLSFTGQNIPTGTYTLRLRVDGVDSFPYIRTGYPQKPWDPYKNPPQFDTKQQVHVP